MPFGRKKPKPKKEAYKPCGKTVTTITGIGRSKINKICSKRKGHLGKCG